MSIQHPLLQPSIERLSFSDLRQRHPGLGELLNGVLFLPFQAVRTTRHRASSPDLREGKVCRVTLSCRWDTRETVDSRPELGLHTPPQRMARSLPSPRSEEHTS